MSKPIVKRVWVNQPSTLQAGHRFHGRLGIAVIDRERDDVRLYYRSGATISSDVCESWLSDGWPEHLLLKDNEVTFASCTVVDCACRDKT